MMCHSLSSMEGQMLGVFQIGFGCGYFFLLGLFGMI
jgi:hypothetical protein